MRKVVDQTISMRHQRLLGMPQVNRTAISLQCSSYIQQATHVYNGYIKTQDRNQPDSGRDGEERLVVAATTASFFAFKQGL